MVTFAPWSQESSGPRALEWARRSEHAAPAAKTILRLHNLLYGRVELGMREKSAEFLDESARVYLPIDELEQAVPSTGPATL